MAQPCLNGWRRGGTAPSVGREVRLLTPRLIKQEVPYLAGAQSKRFAPIIFNNCHPFFLNLMEAIQSTDLVDF